MKRIIRNLLISIVGLVLTTSLIYGKEVRIDLWEQDSPDVSEEIDKWIQVYQKRNPNVRIVRQHYENEALRNKYLRSSVTGDGADIVYAPSDFAGVFATADVIRPVDDLITANKYDQTALEVTKLNDKIWGVPVMVGNHLVLYYNKKFIKDAPQSFDDIIHQGQAFMKGKKNHYGLAMYQSEPFWFAPIMGGYGAWPLKKDDGTVTVAIDNKPTQDALEFLVSLKDQYGILPKDCDYECAKSMFLSQSAPFHINGDWEITTYQEALGPNLGIAPLPIIPATGKHATPLLGGRFLFINAKTTGDELAAVKDFIKFIEKEPVQVRIATKLNRIPATLEARENPLVKQLTIVNDLINTTKYARPSPSEVEMRAAWDGMRIMVQRAMSGKESPAQAVETGQKAAAEALQAIRTEKQSS